MYIGSRIYVHHFQFMCNVIFWILSGEKWKRIVHSWRRAYDMSGDASYPSIKFVAIEIQAVNDLLLAIHLYVIHSSLFIILHV